MFILEMARLDNLVVASLDIEVEDYLVVGF